MDRNAHKNLIALYLEKGGDEKKIVQIKSFSVKNYVRIKFLLKQLNIPVPEETETVTERPTDVSAPPERKGIFKDYISEYPKELHDAFKKRYDYWLEACALKVELNAVHPTDEETAFEIQMKISDCFDKIDKYQGALDHYREHKRIKKTETLADFSQLTPMELIKKRNSTRSNISKRRATIKKMEDALPKNNEPNYRMKLHQINRKKEQLQEVENELDILEEMVGN
ncbi:hypothetical protein [Chryseobacterium terrae]|uniref:Uncharacterized protein n=1 Tax=Chryseobacterium terrae TaxID=3163299 RepID=A0ABW8Y545_9FLAO